MVLQGIDVSHNNGSYSLDGLDFVIVKATQGLGFVDPMHDANVLRAARRGLVVGSYHFLEEGNGASQCETWLNQLSRPGSGVSSQHLYALDVERYGAGERFHPMLADLVAFHQRFHELMPGRKLLVYSYHSFWTETFGGYQHQCEDCLLWSSSIQQAWPPVFGGFPVVTIHQYDTVSVDKDRFAGTRDELVALASPAPSPVPTPDKPGTQGDHMQVVRSKDGGGRGAALLTLDGYAHPVGAAKWSAIVHSGQAGLTVEVATISAADYDAYLVPGAQVARKAEHDFDSFTVDGLDVPDGKVGS